MYVCMYVCDGKKNPADRGRGGKLETRRQKPMRTVQVRFMGERMRPWLKSSLAMGISINASTLINRYYFQIAEPMLGSVSRFARGTAIKIQANIARVQSTRSGAQSCLNATPAESFARLSG